MKHLFVKEIKSPLFPCKLTRLQGKPGIGEHGCPAELNAILITHSLEILKHPLKPIYAKKAGKGHTLQRGFRMDLIREPLGLNGEFIPEFVDKSLADIAEWSDIVRKYSYGNAHYFLTVNILNGYLRILLYPYSDCSTPLQKA